MFGITVEEQGMTVTAPDHSSAFWLHNRLARTSIRYESVRLPENGRIEFRARGTRDFLCIKSIVLHGDILASVVGEG